MNELLSINWTCIAEGGIYNFHNVARGPTDIIGWESGSKSHAQSRERETEDFCSHNLQNLVALIGLGGVENGRSTSLCRNLTAQSSVC